MNKLTARRITRMILLFSLFIPAAGNTQPTLSRIIPEILAVPPNHLLSHLPISAQLKWQAYVQKLGYKDIGVLVIPQWMPFGSFTIGNVIFLNTDLIHQAQEIQERHIEHECWHASQNHTAQQALWGVLYAIIYMCGVSIFNPEITKPHVRAYLTTLGAYCTYALFHNRVVRPLELEAEVGSALKHNTTQKAQAVLADEILREEGVYQKPRSLPQILSDVFFALIAPFHPTAREYLVQLQRATQK